MNIKRYIATIILAIVLLLNFSCTDWLDVKPVDRMSEDQLYSTEAGFRQALNGIYVELNHADLYGDELLVNTVEILAQRYKFSSMGTLTNQYHLAEFDYTTDYAKKCGSRIWEKAYALIANVNKLLKNADSHKDLFTGDSYDLITGEAYALRAFLHFDLLRLFGPVYKTHKEDKSICYNTQFSLSGSDLLPASKVMEYVIADLKEAEDGVKEIMEDKKFGNAGNTMVIEEFMTGREVSVLSFVDGKTIRTMTSAQDHKRAQDGDQGLNTGGMGTFSPSPFYTEEVDEFCKKYVYQPTVDAMAAEGRPFKGIIFFGLMLTADGPKVLEYNARFGDPEAQVVLPRMKNDIIEVMEACVNGTLDQVDLQFEDNAAVCVVLASDGYPVKYEKGIPMYGFENFKGKDGYYCFHAGTKLKDGQIVTNGGRVLGITATGKDLKEARKNAYEATEWITFANKYMRRDIGKAIDEA